jgi:selenide,water dikinase
VLRPLRRIFDAKDHPELLSGLEAPDDAAVWRIDAERAVVLTADFFPPVVDDPYHFGAIAAANALSDIYAMGADPLFAINLVGFPEDLDAAILADVLRGGADKVKEAGAVIAGGHTTVDREPKYGLAVLGMVDPRHVLAKGGARPGDVLLLTKPLGTGVLTTALKRGRADAAEIEAAVGSMMRLSRHAAAILRGFAPHVHAVTDITGFAFIGHAHEVAHASGLELVLRWAELPFLAGAERCAEEGHLAGGLQRNAGHFRPRTSIPAALGAAREALLFDPQTSGGLFAAVDPGAAAAILDAFRRQGEPVWVVGEARAGAPGHIQVV